MTDRKNIQTTKKEIVQYWSKIIDESNLAADWIEAEEYCWMCGKKKSLQRCHIIPASLGGKDEPSNLVLMCEECHIQAPNINNPDFMWSWIKSFHSNILYSYRNEYIEFLYKKMYGTEFSDDVAKVSEAFKAKDKNYPAASEINSISRSLFNETICHYGQQDLNDATLVAIKRLVLIEIVKKNNLDIMFEI